MEFVHHCVYCGWHRDAHSSTLLEPWCARCGCLLRAAPRKGFDPSVEDDAYRPAISRRDATALFALLVTVPFLLPILGVELGDVAFGVPLAMTVFAALRTTAAARRTADRRRAMWAVLTAGLALAAAASAFAIVSLAAGAGETHALYVGAAASLALLAGATLFTAGAMRGVRIDSVVDAVLFGAVLAAVGTWFVALPGFAQGDPALSAVFLVDLLAVVVVTLGTIARDDSRHRRIGWWLAAGCAAAALGDGVVSMSAAGEIGSVPTLVAVLWAVAAYGVAVAADTDTVADETAPPPADKGAGGGWLVARIVLPMVAVLTFPAVAIGLWLADGLQSGPTVFFGLFFLAALVLAFGRQAWLLADNRRAVAAERRLREEAVRRNEELEALTGLATTMTQTLEEAPLVERALSVLHLAARATSSALHSGQGDDLSLAATTGDWPSEHAWAPVVGTPAEPLVERRGGRFVARLPLRARGNEIGVVTLIRSNADPYEDEELELLRLLVDELAVAVQNARDYREKLEQAVRDPLTGLYNRRFFFEALDKEVRRTERYGSTASLVVFDVDDFKRINDSFGHATGDDVLREIGRIAEDVIRPTDTFARIGGEEFALLLPETAQLDALLVAERIRAGVARSAVLADRRVTISGGVSSCPQDATTREELERAADGALYWAKRNGKDLCAVASEVSAAAEETEREAMIAHLYALVATIDAAHLHTRDHSENVATYAVAMGQALGLGRERLLRLRRAALLHDVGKVAISGRILEKPGALTAQEMAEMQLHSRVGATMLRHAGLIDEAVWVRHHHERIDGQGYPDGLAGDDIPWEARIIFVADAFEAMTSDRPYRPGMAVHDALAELRRCSGTQFEPAIVEAMCELVQSGELAVTALRGGGPGGVSTPVGAS